MRQHQAGADLTLVRRLGLIELHITLQPTPGEEPARMLTRLDALLREHGAQVTRMEVFGQRGLYPEFFQTMRRIIGEVRWPVMWVEGASFDGSPIAGLHVMAVSGVDLQPVWLGDRIVGTAFSDSFARHCLLGSVLPTDLLASRERQSREVFESLALALDTVGMKPRYIARTWLYLDDLLSWYDVLNRVRTGIFKEWDLFTTGVPASTGIGAENPHGAAMFAAAWATVPHSGECRVSEVVSSLQCPAGSYGSSFARAMEWATPGHRRLTVSGTASIESGGASVHQGDIRAQVDLTMSVVAAILESRGASFADVTRATAYIKHPCDAACLDEWFGRTGAALRDRAGYHHHRAGERSACMKAALLFMWDYSWHPTHGRNKSQRRARLNPRQVRRP